MSTKRAKSKDESKATSKRSGSKPRKNSKPPNDPHPITDVIAPPKTADVVRSKTPASNGAVSPQPPQINISFEGTVKGPNSNDFDPEAACEKLHKAFKGLGTDEKQLIEVIGSHTNWQRQEIKKKYKQMFGRDLLNDLEDELGGHFLDLSLALFCPAHLYDAHVINKAISGTGTDEHALIEVLCTRSNSEIELIKEAYHTEFRRNLERDIATEVSGDFGRLMRSITTASRDEHKELDSKLAESDAQKLISGGVEKLGTDELLFNTLFCLRSWPQLKTTFDAYRRKTDSDIELDIRKEFHGEMRDALLSIVKVAKNMQAYFAEKLSEAMKGAGTDDEALIRIIVARSEIDLALIKEEYQKRYKKTLAKAIKEDCSGDYCRLLLKLVGS